MDSNRALFAILTPLLLANIGMWARYTHQPFVAALWAIILVGCYMTMWKR